MRDKPVLQRKPRHGRRYVVWSLVTLAVMGAAALPLHRGWVRGAGTMFNAPLRWIPRDSKARADFNEFLSRFPSHEMVLVSWPGCTVDDPRLAELAEALRDKRAANLASGGRELYSKVLTGYTMLRRLKDEPLSLSRRQALRRLEGLLVGPDGRTSCAVVVLTDYGAKKRRETVDRILDAAAERLGLGREELYLAGPPIDGIAIDDESLRSIRRFAGPSALISLLLCMLCLRSIWLAIPILAAGVFGQALMIASVYYSGENMNAVLIVLPPLVFVLTVSAGVHLVNYFYDAERNGVPADAVTAALKKAWGPCCLAAVTTAIGLLSLMVSTVFPVRQFGLLAAIGVIVTALLLFSLAPGAMVVWQWWQSYRNRRQPGRRAAPATTKREIAGPAAGFVWRRARVIRVLAIILMLACGVGLVRLRTSIDVVSLLSGENRAVRDFHWFQENIGPLVPVEVVIHFGRDCPLDLLERLELVGAVHARVRGIENVDGTMSALSYLPPIPQRGGARQLTARTVYRHHVSENKQAIEAAQYLATDNSDQWWRISARIPGKAGYDYGAFLERLKNEVRPLIDAYRGRCNGAIDVTTTGVTAVVYQVQRSLLADLFYSYLTALALIAVVMVIALRSLFGGLLAMLPNVFPTLLFFGSMGWSGQSIGIGTVMTASVTLGMAVDGTFHFLKWYRHETRRGKSGEAAVTYSFRHCGRAIWQTTVICASGLLIYSFSGFLPARHFAWVLLVLLLLAMVGDLVLLPSLLAGRLGAEVTRGRDRKDAACDASPGRDLDGRQAPIIGRQLSRIGYHDTRPTRRARRFIASTLKLIRVVSGSSPTRTREDIQSP